MEVPRPHDHQLAAVSAKLDALLRTSREAHSDVATVDELEPEEIEEKRHKDSHGES